MMNNDKRAYVSNRFIFSPKEISAFVRVYVADISHGILNYGEL